MPQPVNSERRREVLDEYFRLKEGRAEVRRRLAGSTDAQRDRLEAESRAAAGRMRQLTDEYRALLERVPLSRCPFCGEAVVLPFDRHGLDGLYWDYDGAVRPPVPRPCPHFLVLSGAMKLVLPPTRVPMLAKPGPEVPWVVPRLLALPSVRAVVSTIPVGAHTGYPIAYFADRDPNVDLVNEWGRSIYETYAADGERGWHEVVEVDSDYDYEVAPWLRQGQLLWIAPRDERLAVQRGVTGSPYLGLPGRRGVVKVQNGRTWVFGWELG